MQRVNINITIIFGCTHEKCTLFICTKTFFVYRAIVNVFVIKIFFSKDFFRNTIRASNSLDPDQDDVLSVRVLVQIVCKVTVSQEKW